jgi:hypothetical protein
MGLPEILVLASLAILCFGGRRLSDLADELRDALNNFRGGPPTPMHPSPANDSALLAPDPEDREVDLRLRPAHRGVVPHEHQVVLCVQTNKI